MKKRVRKPHSLLGKEFVEIDKNGYRIKCFVAAIDPKKGITIKPLDPKKIGTYFALSAQGNFMCINIKDTYYESRGGISGKEIYKAVSKFLKTHDVFTQEEIYNSFKMNPTKRSMGFMPDCPFGGQ